jgi:hypothetical protein
MKGDFNLRFLLIEIKCLLCDHNYKNAIDNLYVNDVEKICSKCGKEVYK